MRVLIVTPEFPPDHGGGIATYCGEMSRALSQEGATVDVVRGSAFVQGGEAHATESGKAFGLDASFYRVWLQRLEYLEIFGELRRHLAAAFAIHEQLRAGEDYDAVEVTDWGLLFLPWVTQRCSRTLVQLHGSCGQILLHEPAPPRGAEALLTLHLEAAALAGASGVSSYSKANASWWEAVARRSVSSLPPPFSPIGDEPPVGAATRNAWLTVGRIQSWKGPDVTCKAWTALGDEAPLLEWVGSDTKDNWTGASMDAVLTERYPRAWRRSIRPIGQMSRLDTLARMRSARAVLVPSDWDVFNFVAVEAMASGKVVIVSDGAGASELVQHGRNGIVFKRGDASGLAEAVRDVSSLDDGTMRDIGLRARETVKTALAPSVIAKCRIQQYAELGQHDSTTQRPHLDVVQPGNGYDPLSVLDGLPLKRLAAYGAARAVSTLLGRRWRR